MSFSDAGPDRFDPKLSEAGPGRFGLKFFEAGPFLTEIFTGSAVFMPGWAIYMSDWAGLRLSVRVRI